MTESSVGVAARSIEQVLELSADAQIERRGVAKDSPEFHKLTGAILAYGKVLALLTALQAQEEFSPVVAQYEFSGCVALVS